MNKPEFIKQVGIRGIHVDNLGDDLVRFRYKDYGLSAHCMPNGFHYRETPELVMDYTEDTVNHIDTLFKRLGGNW